MPSIIFKLTQAGRAALVNASNTGTQARTVVSVGVTATTFTPTDALAAIPNEIKRIATLAGDVVDAGTVHVTVRDDGTDSYTVRGLGLWLDNGVLLGTYSQAEPIVEKSRASIMLLACDLRVLDGGVDISTLIFGNKDFLNPPATTERQGVVELATEAEADALEDAQRAATPRSLRGLFARAALAARLIVAGTGLKGGGNLYGDRTISLADTPVTPGQYGSASAVPSIVVDAQGRINYAGTVGVAAPWAGITGLPRWLLSERGFVSMDAENVDFNDVQEPGMYQTGGPRRLAKNSPPAYPFGLLLVLGVAWGPRTQLYFSHDGQQLYRTKYNDSDWSPWKRAAILGDDATFKDLKAATFAGDGYGLSGLRWSNLIERPTTLGGYGITDAAASARRIVAGTGLAGGGDLAEDRTLSLANTPVTPGQYGSASAVPSFVVDAQGRITYAGAFSVAAPWAGITGMPRWVMHDKGFVEMGDDSRDFNDVTEPGTYKTGGERSTTKNRPPAYPYGVLMVLGAESGPRTQLYFSHEGEMLYRTKYNAQDWSSWMRPALDGMDATFKNLTAQATLRGAELRIGEDGATATGLLKKSGGALQLDTWGAAAPLRLGGSAVEFKTETGSAVEARHWADQRFYGDAKTVYGPNTTWAGKLIVGSGDWITTADDAAALAGTNGNVHLDPAKGRKVHLNFYRGAGVVIGNGAMGTVAEITPSGYAWFGGRVDAEGLAARGDSRVMAGPNSQGRYLALGGNGVEGIDRSNTGSVLVSVGNLHIDPAGGYATYMNWYSGKGVIFGNGAGTQCASIDENGHATVEGLTVAGCTGGVVPPGTIIQYSGHNAPVGYLRANGAAVSRTTYAALFAAIGTTHGEGDGSTTFNLPDRRGVFMRGVDDGRGIDPGRALGSFQGSQNAAHGHGATIHENGWHGHGASASGVGDHVHNMTFRPYQWDHGITGEVGDNGDPNYGAQVTSGTMQGAGAHGHTIWIEGSGTHTHAISIAADGGNEARPINAADLFCIKY